jgi:all-trans-8'-apo-beta-carotenal 15,15'-oxygenase
VAPNCGNICAEHPHVNPLWQTRRAKHVYAVASNTVGDSSAPCGYVRLDVEGGELGEEERRRSEYFFGARCFAGEPVVVQKPGAGERETGAWLLGAVHDAASETAFLAVFDLDERLADGPVARIEIPFAIPHGLHGSFAADTDNRCSVF